MGSVERSVAAYSNAPASSAALLLRTQSRGHDSDGVLDLGIIVDHDGRSGGDWRAIRCTVKAVREPRPARSAGFLGRRVIQSARCGSKS